MVRVNLINPKYLADQHLIAEYAEILMLVAYIKRHPRPDNLPKEYCLGTGHQRFFKNKLLYLKKRHELLKKEMRKRGFTPNKTLSLKRFKKELLKDYKPKNKDKKIIKKRLIQKLNKRPKFYRYYSKNKPKKFLTNLVKKAK